MLFDIPDNFQLTADQAAQLAGCCKETIINHTAPAKKESRYFLKSRRNGKAGTIKIYFKDFLTYLENTGRGYLPGEENLTV